MLMPYARMTAISNSILKKLLHPLQIRQTTVTTFRPGKILSSVPNEPLAKTYNLPNEPLVFI